jgi:hypothetical protein
MTNKPDNKADATPTEAEIAKATKEGVLDRVAEAANLQDDPAVKGDPPEGDRYIGKSEIMQYAHYVDFDLEGLKAALDPKADNAIADNKVAGLLGLERGGKNRTDFVKAYMDRLRIANPKLKSPYEVTDAGPPYTNDVTQVTKL